MLEIPGKQYFPLLPFDQDIPFFEIIKIEPRQILPDELSSNDSSETDLEIKGDSINIYNNYNQNQSLSKPSHKNKSPVKMNENAANFGYSFYKIFTSRKKFQKKFVVMIHNEICDKLNIRKVTREESRSIHLYFVNFAMHSERILMYIQKNKSDIIQKLPELNEILK